MFFFGQFVSSSLCAKIRCTVNDGFQRLAHFVISLDSTIRLSSFTISGPIHTEEADEDEKAVEDLKKGRALSFRIKLSLR